jgi:competence protein ComGC
MKIVVQKPGFGRGGFSFVELMVIVLILGLLALLVFPAMASARRKARSAKCVNHLRQLYVAYDAWNADKETKRPPFGHGWPGMWVKYLDGNTDVLVCPEDPEPVRTAAELAFDVSYTDVRGFQPRGGYYYTRGLWDAGWKNNWYGNALFRQSNVVGNAYRLWFHEVVGSTQYGSGGRFVDVLEMSVVEQDDVALFTSLGPTSYSSWRERTNVNYHVYDSSGRLLAADFRTQVGLTITGRMVRTSYGLNPFVFPAPGEDRILLLDYYKVEARTNDPWASWPSNPEPSLLRHRGRCNVLYANGTVEALNWTEFSPANRSQLTNYWLPQYMR